MAELIFLDLEWNTTFYRGKDGQRLPFHELLEVAAMKVDQATGAMEDSFHSYITPRWAGRSTTAPTACFPTAGRSCGSCWTTPPPFWTWGPAFLHWCGENRCSSSGATTTWRCCCGTSSSTTSPSIRAGSASSSTSSTLYQKLYGGDSWLSALPGEGRCRSWAGCGFGLPQRLERYLLYRHGLSDHAGPVPRPDPVPQAPEAEGPPSPVGAGPGYI